MMAFLDDVKKGLTDVSETIVKKSTELVEIQKLKMKKTSLESDIKRDYALLGKLYFAKMEADGTQSETPEAAEYFERIVHARDAVEEVALKISKLNHEKSCRACGAKVPLDTIYCPKCGTRFEDEAEEDAGEAEDEAQMQEEVQPETEEAAADAGAAQDSEAEPQAEDIYPETAQETDGADAEVQEDGSKEDSQAEEKDKDSVQQ